MQYKKNEGAKKTSSGKCLPLNGLYGTLMLFVIGSIVFSTYLVIIGSDNQIFWLLCAPQALFAAVLLTYLTYNK